LDRSTLPMFLDRLGGLLVTGNSNSTLKKTLTEPCGTPASSEPASSL
jgi:hypothetical protein